jgi:signal recognition particle subunit SRP54
MFEQLTTRFQEVFYRWRQRGRLTEKDIDEGLQEIRRALLEADVHFKVIKTFMEEVRQRALAQPEVLQSLTPEQYLIKIVRDTLVDVLGREVRPLAFSRTPPTVILLLGLQGSGKTTTAAKLAKWVKEQGHYPVMVSTDVRRPAAIQQLKVLGEKVPCDVLEYPLPNRPEAIAEDALRQAKLRGYSVLIVDTAGRLHVDPDLMAEMVRIRDVLRPHEVLYVADAMTGQDAVRSALAFFKAVDFTGVVLTKMDGDARGGAALSIVQVTQRPILFVGVGEKIDGLEVFHPDRMAQRILGMGDVLSLIEKAEKAVRREEAAELQKKILKDEITFEDLLTQIRMIRRMGPIRQWASLIPGLPTEAMDEMDEDDLRRLEAIILSMTPQERRYPRILNASRKRRIARGSGTTLQDVNEAIRLLQDLQTMAHHIRKTAWGKVMRRFLS